MRKILLIFILSSILGSLFGQDSLKYSSRSHLKTTLGVDIPLSKLYNDDITDNLWHGKHSFSWQMYSLSFFFNNYLGIENSLYLSFSNGNSERPKQIRDYLSSNYPNHYLYTTMFDNISSTYGRFTLSLIYRYETARFYVYPKLMGGFYFMKLADGIFYLKEKDTEELLQLSYKPQKTNSIYGVVGLSVSVGYKFSRRFYLNLDLPFFYTRVNTQYIKTLTDKNSDVVLKEEKVGGKKNLFSFMPTLGFVVVLKHRKK